MLAALLDVTGTPSENTSLPFLFSPSPVVSHSDDGPVASSIWVVRPEGLNGRPTGIAPGSQVTLDLPDAPGLVITIDAVESTSGSDWALLGHPTGNEGGMVNVEFGDGGLAGYVRLPGRAEYHLSPGANPGEVEIRRSRPTGRSICGTHPSHIPSLRRAGVDPAADPLPPADTLEAPTEVDVMFLYTPQALNGEGNEAGILRRVRESLDEANLRFANSQINVHLNIVHVGRISYTESGSINTDVARLAAGTGGFSPVATLRRDYKADLVCVITELENEGLAGVAHDIPPATGNASGAFAAIRRVALGKGNMLLTHELGHLFGCAHDREHIGDLNSSYYTQRRPYIFGHRFEVEGVTYVDVMSYEPGIYVPYFSNPRLDLDGVPMGVAAGASRPSDGARTINETAPYVARYFNARSRVEFVRARQGCAETGGSVTVQLRRSGDLNTSTTVTVSLEAGGTATSGVDFEPTIPAVVSFETNQATAEVVFTPLQDGLPESPESVRLRLNNLRGEHGLAPQATCEIVVVDRPEQLLDADVEFPDGEIAFLDSASECRVRVRYAGGLSDTASTPAVLAYRTVEGTALSGLDFQAMEGTLTNSPSESEWEVRIPILPRPEPGADRSFALVVGSKTNTLRIVDAQRVGAPAVLTSKVVESDGYWSAWRRGDGSRLIWGGFSKINGTGRDSVAFLKPDGSIDDTFRPPEILLGHRRLEGLGAGVWSWNPFPRINVAVPQSDGSVLVAGGFSRVAGQARTTLVRLRPDGSLDTGFGSDLRFDGQIFAMAVQPDGRIVVGGSFEKINGVRRAFVARLMPDGTVDTSFQPKGGPASDWTVWIEAIALQPDGGILIGGNFQRVDTLTRPNLARLLPNGTVDSQFKARLGASGTVWHLNLQADGKIVAAGLFDTLNGRTSRKLGRLNADGSNDTGFVPPNPDGEVIGTATIPDGRLLIHGEFSKVGGHTRPGLAILAPNGTLDTTVDLGSGPNGFVGRFGNGVDPSGWLHLVGDFTAFNGVPVPGQVRVRLGELAPALGSSEWRDGRLKAELHGIAGATYPLESSADLHEWEPAGEFRLEGWDSHGEVSVPASAENRFLRAVLPAP